MASVAVQATHIRLFVTTLASPVSPFFITHKASHPSLNHLLAGFYSILPIEGKT